MSATDARLEPGFHLLRPYGVPFIGRDGVLTVRLRGAEPETQMVILYDHPDLVDAQIIERERLCPACNRWDRPEMMAEPGTYPADRKWCAECRIRLRKSRMSVRLYSSTSYSNNRGG
jgi:hypothetical protein